MTITDRVSSPRFVGRREELARLEALLDAARSGDPMTALVTGDAGIGKTRLVAELARRAQTVGVQVLTGCCANVADDVLPFGPLVDVLDQTVRTHGVGRVLELAGPTGDELVRLAPALGVGRSQPLETTRASGTRMYQALTALLTGLAARKPLLLVIEDLHWIDRSTRDLLTLLVRSLRGRVMVVMTVRSDELPETDPLHRFLAEMERAGAARVRLSGLGRSDQARQIGAILGVPPSSDLVDRVHGRAEGNPFFAEELLAFDGSADDLPLSVRELLVSRVRSLPEAALEVAQVGALAGRGMTHGLLAATTELTDGGLEQAIRTLVDHHVLVPEGFSDVLSFRHALLRETIRSTILPGAALRIHTRLATALTERPDLGATDGYGVAARVARHWHLAGDKHRTLVSSLVAASSAEEALAWPTALTNYERAISLLDVLPDANTLLEKPRYQVLWAAAETAHLSAHPDRAAQLIRAAISAIDVDRPESVDLDLHHAYLHERLGRYLWMAADGVASLAAYEQAIELVPTHEATCWQAAIYSGYGQILMLLGRFHDSIAWCERAIEITHQVEFARSTEGHARNTLGVGLAYLGDVDAGIEHLRVARTIAEEEFDDVDDIARAIVNLHTVLFDAGRLEEAAEIAVTGIETIDGLGLARRKGVWCRCDAASALLELGRTDEAGSLMEQAVDLQPAGIDAVRSALVRGELALQVGDTTAADAHLAQALEGGRAILDGQLNAPVYTALVERRLLDDPRAALVLAEEGRRRLATDEDAAFCVPLQAAAVRAAAQAALDPCGDRADAETAIAAGRSWFAAAREAVARDPAAKPAPAAHLCTAEAELTRAEGRSSPPAWTRAADSWEALRRPYRRAYCLWRRAEALLGEGDRDAAAVALHEAGAVANQIGAEGLKAEIADLARRARLRRTDPSSDRPDGTATPLTPREREVLVLVAEGQTDRQIGETLFISHRTVERHVSNVLAKLGASTRTEASAIAGRERLLLH